MTGQVHGCVGHGDSALAYSTLRMKHLGLESRKMSGKATGKYSLKGSDFEGGMGSLGLEIQLQQSCPHDSPGMRGQRDIRMGHYQA